MLTTFGLLGPGKGLELAVAALPMIVARHPRAHYVIAGATHPEVLRASGEAYRHGLIALARRSGVADHVVFVDAFLSESELAHLLARTTIYLTPYRGMEQTCSGTLAFAAGCPVVSAPYQYAREMFTDYTGAGVLVPPDDPAAIAAAVCGLFDDPDRLARAGTASRTADARPAWTNVAAGFAEVLAACPDRPARRRPRRSGGRHGTRCTSTTCTLLLVDDVGIIQFARGIIPDPGSGYTVDDAAPGSSGPSTDTTRRERPMPRGRPDRRRRRGRPHRCGRRRDPLPRQPARLGIGAARRPRHPDQTGSAHCRRPATRP